MTIDQLKASWAQYDQLDAAWLESLPVAKRAALGGVAEEMHLANCARSEAERAATLAWRAVGRDLASLLRGPMSTRLLHMLAAPLLGRFGGAMLRAAVAESDRADAAELNEAKAKGERDEARRFHASAAEAYDSMCHCAWEDGEYKSKLCHEIETLRSEAESARVDDEERMRAAALLESLSSERDELRRRCDRLTESHANAATEVTQAMRSLDESESLLHAIRIERNDSRTDAARCHHEVHGTMARIAELEREQTELKQRCDWLTELRNEETQDAAEKKTVAEALEHALRTTLRERDAALADAARLRNVLDDATALLAAVEQERDSIARTRDEAIAMIADMQRNPTDNDRRIDE